MAHLKLVEAENLESLYQSCQAVLELPGLEVGKIFLNVEADSILGLNQLEGFVTADDFFLRGTVADFERLVEASQAHGFSNLFLVSSESPGRMVLTMKAPAAFREQGWFCVSGSSAAVKIAEEFGVSVRLGSDDEIAINFNERNEVVRYLQAALADFRGRFLQGETLAAEVVGGFQLIEELMLGGAVDPSREFPGYVGFGPDGVLPHTNVDESRIPGLVSFLSQVGVWKIRLNWEIIGLGGRKYASWNVLELCQRSSKSGKAIGRIFSLSQIPVGLRRAIEKRLFP